MNHPCKVNDQAYNISVIISHKEQKGEQEKRRGFHNNPAKPVTDHCAPFITDKFSIGSIYPEKNYENDQAGKYPACNYDIKCIL